ncbi:hypothetical protein QO006_002225, partial [Deinococcus enclensis]|nr:hypothetical protein [Deinococcus enclensis]
MTDSTTAAPVANPEPLMLVEAREAPEVVRRQLLSNREAVQALVTALRS